jgi:DNA-binding transcriptional regulator PaaX
MQSDKKVSAENMLKPLREYKNGELAVIILKGLALGGFIVACFALPGLAQVATLFQPKNTRERYRIKRTVYRLKEHGFIHIDKHAHIILTPKGRKVLQKYRVGDLAIKRPHLWDGWWRIIIFDIPNEKRRERNSVRFHLKRMGFVPIQKSTFAIPFECKKELEALGSYYGVRNFIKYILAKDFDGSKPLKTLFKI